ncbi:hypothetical protein YQE_00894, partial [Dendroctonus ponderosae]
MSVVFLGENRNKVLYKRSSFDRNDKSKPVTGVVGRAETLSSVFFLAAFLFYAKATINKKPTDWKFIGMSMLSIATAMLCKEQGITIAGVCAAYEIFVIQRVKLEDMKSFAKSAVTPKSSFHLPKSNAAAKRLFVLFIFTILLLLARLQIMGSQLPVFTRFDNPASVAPSPSKQLTYHYLISVNVWLLLFPCNLCCDWTMGTIPLVESFLDMRNLTTIATYLFLLLLIATAFLTENRHQRVVLIMSTSLLVLPFIPASNLFFPVGFVVAERVLYMPSMGFCMLIGYGWQITSRRTGKKIAWTFVGLLVISHGWKTYLRNWDWENEYTIFMSGLRVNQRNAKLFNNVGHALESQGHFDEALKFFKTAVKVQHDDVGAYINVGRTYNHLKMLEEADMLYRQAISMRADYTQAYINRGDILIKLNRTIEAQEVYERALLYDSNNPDIYYNVSRISSASTLQCSLKLPSIFQLGVVFLEQGKASQALAYLDKALEIDPEHEQALLNSAILLQEFGRPDFRKTAKERLLKLLIKDKNNERVHFNLGMLAMDEKNIAEAEQWFRRAVHLKVDFRSALFNLALLLADDVRPLEAAPFLNQLVKYHPDHVKGLILLGDIYINSIKDVDAAENCYKRILEIEPDNIQGLHNLCVVHVERGKLFDAQTCLEKAHQLAPEEDYIVKHLGIVQNRIGKLHLNEDVADNKESKVVSNKSVDENEKKTEPVISRETEKQRYSSRVVNTEPMFLKSIGDANEFHSLKVEEVASSKKVEHNTSSSDRRRS